MPPTTVPPLPRHAVPCERAAGSMANANARASRRAVLSFGAFVHRKSLLSLHPKRRLRINYGIALCVNKLNVHSVSFARPGECCVRVQPAATTKQTKLKKILVWYHKNFDLRPSSGRRQELVVVCVREGMSASAKGEASARRSGVDVASGRPEPISGGGLNAVKQMSTSRSAATLRLRKELGPAARPAAPTASRPTSAISVWLPVRRKTRSRPSFPACRIPSSWWRCPQRARCRRSCGWCSG
eukprot:scaffold20532_cov123-Isochrysis_galbana.AAC.3